MNKYETIKLSLRQLSADVKGGLSLQELIDKYQLPPASMKKALKEAGLTPKRKPKPRYILIDDVTTEENNQTPVNQTTI